MKKGFLLDKDGREKMEVDMELKKAFAELQVKLAEGKKGIRECDIERDMLTYQRRKAALTMEELSSLPPQTPAFATLGRCFVSQTLDEATTGIGQEMEKADAAIAALDKRKDYLQKSIKEQENNLRDMVTQRQAQKS